MQLCNTCGFVINEDDSKCGNCASPIPGNEELFSKFQSTPTVEKPVVEQPVPEKIISPSLALSEYIPKKTIVILLVAGMLVAPQTQSLMSGSLDYWDEMNTPYYNIPESLTLNLIRNFTIYMEDGKSSEYELILSKPENRPSWPQQSTNIWQDIERINVNPQFEEDEIGRMRWSGELSGVERAYVSIEYEMTIHTIRPDLTIEDSGTIEDMPEGYDIYLEDEWLIEPSLPEIQDLASEMTNGTNGNVIQILRNIFDYISSGYIYQASSIPKSCPESMESGYGDCDDFSILFSSIARAAGIPAWLELGKIPAFIDNRGSCDLQDWGGHAWVNALVPLKDGTSIVVSIDLANSYFSWMPPYRISDWVDNGNGDDLSSYYYLFSSNGTGKATYIENSYVSSCTTSGNIKLTEL
ncbi:uncharacterized protein METZ01_LOCUS227534 [marine metagenome]|uniref:Transglutaminase-like domain-containing protein n=1 Tax=marine metagenome TaxID=408172 RepID=A0A382GHP7_9ZZZZ